jgi:histone arginine demethylase JMJD6
VAAAGLETNHRHSNPPRVAEALAGRSMPPREGHTLLWPDPGPAAPLPPLSCKSQRKVARVKRKHRSELQDWAKQSHAAAWAHWKKRLLAQATLSPPKLHARDLTAESFRRDFQVPMRPAVIAGLADDWPARQSWSFEALLDKHPGLKLKCGEDDDEDPLKLKLKTFLRYQASEARLDDSPLYVFDSSFERDTSPLLRDFSVPFIFDQDLFELVSNRRRPPHRWFLLGPERSGTCLHTDPLGTSAWNTSCRGRKLWAFFPPTAPRQLIKGRQFVRPGGDDEAVDWFCLLLPQIRAQLPSQQQDFFFFVQEAGETVFVPHDWWHAVLNLDDTVAVTQNFVDSANFARAWSVTRKGRRKMARKWRERLQQVHPELYAQSLAIDAADGFDLDAEIAAKSARRRAKSGGE